MSRDHVGHREIAQFATDRVNLPKAKADEYRAQARRLREKLEGYLNEHPDFTLRKMLISGSLAKGTALRSLNDIDVAFRAPSYHRIAYKLLIILKQAGSPNIGIVRIADCDGDPISARLVPENICNCGVGIQIGRHFKQLRNFRHQTVIMGTGLEVLKFRPDIFSDRISWVLCRLFFANDCSRDGAGFFVHMKM